MEAHISKYQFVAQFKVNFVYSYKLMYNIPTFKCINSHRKPYSTVFHTFSLESLHNRCFQLGSVVHFVLWFNSPLTIPTS